MDKLEETTSLALERIKDAQDRLGSTLNGQGSPSYLVIRLGYKAVQTARAIHVLCANGYADQAYSKCRELMELEANIFFIMTSGDLAEICNRYSESSFARYYKYVSENDLFSDMPADKWAEMTNDYHVLISKYDARGENIHKKDGWAIAWRDNYTRKIEADNVRKRAEQSMPYLTNNPNLLHDVWKSHWYHANEAIHNDPRVLFMDLSSDAENTVVTGSSSFGLREPIQGAARMILNISSVISNNIPGKQTKISETLGRKTMAAATDTTRLLDDVPVGANAWWQRREQDK